MRRSCLYILCGIALVLLSIGCSKGPRVIPRGKMARIYAEMLVTDQWINVTPSVKRLADTSMVYEPILEKYGYTSEDYRRSVDVYMDDPERFSRILRSTTEILDKRIAELKSLKAQQEDLENNKFVITTDFKAEDYFPFLSSEPYVHYYDSLSVEYDTAGFYRFSSIERADTVYDRLEMVVRADTLAVSDSVVSDGAIATHDAIVRNGKAAPVDTVRDLPKRMNDVHGREDARRRAGKSMGIMMKEVTPSTEKQPE